ncbi:5013_t:CDS:1, partial [Funneliformis geosporum]
MTRVKNNHSNKCPPIICSAYFRETPAKDYSFFGFYQYRQKQPDFTYSFQKEALKLKNDLNVLVKDDSEEVKTA